MSLSCVFYFVFLSCVVHLISERHLFHNVSHVFLHHGRGYAQGVFLSPRNVHLSRLPCLFHVRHIGCSANGAVILPRIVGGEFLKRRILYVVNGSASFNQELLKIQLSGDVHPEPGPYTSSVNTTSNERLFSRRIYPSFMLMRGVLLIRWICFTWKLLVRFMMLSFWSRHI